MPNPFWLILIVSVLLGVLAQKKKGRTGAAWAALAFVLILLGYLASLFLLGFSRSPHDGTAAGNLAAGVTSIIFVGGLLLIAILTLPKKRPIMVTESMVQIPEARTLADLGGLAPSRLPCPFCAEPALPAATVCPRCRRDLPDGWAAGQKRAADLAHFAPPRQGAP